MEDVCLLAIARTELLYGGDISPRLKADEAAVAAFLTHVAVLDFPEEAALHYGHHPRPPETKR